MAPLERVWVAGGRSGIQGPSFIAGALDRKLARERPAILAALQRIFPGGTPNAYAAYGLRRFVS